MDDRALAAHDCSAAHALKSGWAPVRRVCRTGGLGNGPGSRRRGPRIPLERRAYATAITPAVTSVRRSPIIFATPRGSRLLRCMTTMPPDAVTRTQGRLSPNDHDANHAQRTVAPATPEKLRASAYLTGKPDAQTNGAELGVRRARVTALSPRYCHRNTGEWLVSDRCNACTGTAENADPLVRFRFRAGHRHDHHDPEPAPCNRVLPRTWPISEPHDAFPSRITCCLRHCWPSRPAVAVDRHRGHHHRRRHRAS